MRKLAIGILLAGAAVAPALAQDSGDGRWHHDQQQGSRDGHQQRPQVQSPQQQEARGRFNGGNFYRQQQAPQFVGQQQAPQFVRQQQAPQFVRQQQAPQFIRQQQVQPGQQGAWMRGRADGRVNVAPQAEVQQRTYGYRGSAQPGTERNGGWYGQRGAVPQHYGEGSRYASGGWNRDWRDDHRYDWRRYRDSHRSVFRLGVYIDPFGYGYQPFAIGYRLPPIYFGSQYWIDPGLYDLPYPPPGTAWVRYWNDALLVDTYTGQIVDVIQGFFW